MRQSLQATGVADFQDLALLKLARAEMVGKVLTPGGQWGVMQKEKWEAFVSFLEGLGEVESGTVAKGVVDTFYDNSFLL